MAAGGLRLGASTNFHGLGAYRIRDMCPRSAGEGRLPRYACNNLAYEHGCYAYYCARGWPRGWGPEARSGQPCARLGAHRNAGARAVHEYAYVLLQRAINCIHAMPMMALSSGAQQILQWQASALLYASLALAEVPGVRVRYICKERRNAHSEVCVLYMV